MVALRELLELTQQELAARCGVAQSLISGVERGNRELTDELAIKLSNATRTPLSFFDAEPSEVDADAVNFRKAARASSKSIASALRRYWEAERICLTLFDAADHHGLALPLAQDIPISNDDIETIADRAREHLAIPPDAPVRHVMRAMERAGIGVVALTRIGDVNDSLDGHSGMSRGRPEDGRAVVAYVPATAGDRQRMTLAHELGHVLLHAHRQLPLKIREAEAMRFAGAFLLPKHAALEELSPTLNLNGYARVKAKWGISIQALIRRALDLGVVSRDRYRSLMVQVSGRGWRTREPVEVGIEKPALMWALLTRRYGPTPYLPASAELGAAPEFLETWIPPRHQQESTAGSGGGKATVTALLPR
ncbi:helix-turn-helix domain-containing protein [Mycobacterium avium]|uniref:helix-turn-helix domain-containing protein n=1 Tax=Mycobacterium avium TaxID=1764 RepID=UPI0015C4338C|nr:XRE family transcriptional regulator [Mycobacterium avium]